MSGATSSCCNSLNVAVVLVTASLTSFRHPVLSDVTMAPYYLPLLIIVLEIFCNPVLIPNFNLLVFNIRVNVIG